MSLFYETGGWGIVEIFHACNIIFIGLSIVGEYDAVKNPFAIERFYTLHSLISYNY